jgi:hypothetical protein
MVPPLFYRKIIESMPAEFMAPEGQSSGLPAEPEGSRAKARPQAKAEAKPPGIGGRPPQRDSGGITDRGYS